MSVWGVLGGGESYSHMEMLRFDRGVRGWKSDVWGPINKSLSGRRQIGECRDTETN